MAHAALRPTPARFHSGLKYGWVFVGLALLGGCTDAPLPGPVHPVPESATPARPSPPRPLAPALKQAYRSILAQRFDEARALAQRYLEQHPGEAQAHLMIGLSYFKADNHGAARPHLEKALALDPAYYITHDYLGEALFSLGELPSAREHYEAFLSHAPGQPRIHIRLGMIEFEQGKMDKSVQHYSRALELLDELRVADPGRYKRQQSDLADAHARLGDVFFATGDYAAARNELVQATRIWPRNISAFFTLSLVHRRLGEEDLADKALQHYQSTRQAIVNQQGSAGR